MSLEFTEEAMKKPEELKERGRKYGAPDFEKRNFFRGVVDGRYKLCAGSARRNTAIRQRSTNSSEPAMLRCTTS